MVLTMMAMAFAMVWIFCGARVHAIMQRRCLSQKGSPVRTDAYVDLDSLQECGVVLGYMAGPVMLLLVMAYELGDGTTLRRFRAWRKAQQ